MKNSNDAICNRTRDLPVYSTLRHSKRSHKTMTNLKELRRATILLKLEIIWFMYQKPRKRKPLLYMCFYTSQWNSVGQNYMHQSE